MEINAYLIVKWIDKRILINIPNVSKRKSLIHIFIKPIKNNFENDNKNKIIADKHTYFTNQKTFFFVSNLILIIIFLCYFENPKYYTNIY